MKQKGRKVRQERGVNPESPEAEYIHQFIAYGAMGMVKQWLEEGMPLSREEMMTLAERLTRPILQMLVEG